MNYHTNYHSSRFCDRLFSATGGLHLYRSSDSSLYIHTLIHTHTHTHTHTYTYTTSHTYTYTTSHTQTHTQIRTQALTHTHTHTHIHTLTTPLYTYTRKSLLYSTAVSPLEQLMHQQHTLAQDLYANDIRQVLVTCAQYFKK